MPPHIINLLLTTHSFKVNKNDISILDYNISTDNEFKSKSFHNDVFLRYAGELHCQSDLADDFAYAWNKLAVPDYFKDYTHEKIGQTLTLYLQQKISTFNYFLKFLWFVKDNAAAVKTSFIQLYSNVGYFISNENIQMVTKCDATVTAEVFSEEELQTALSINNAFTSIAKSSFITKSQLDKQLTTASINTKGGFFAKDYDENRNYNDFNRIERAFRFLALARQSNFLPTKIALYIPILECLFSTDPSEATQKVSERTAFYIGYTSSEKQQIFDIVNDGYRLRSDYIHGSVLNKKKKHTDVETQKKISTNLDDLLRKVMTKVIIEDSERFIDEGNLPNYLKYLIFK